MAANQKSINDKKDLYFYEHGAFFIYIHHGCDNLFVGKMDTENASSGTSSSGMNLNKYRSFDIIFVRNNLY